MLRNDSPSAAVRRDTYAETASCSKLQGDRELVLRREECVLHGRGVIALGQPREAATELLEFVCD